MAHRSRHIEVVSLGGGIQSTALVILNVTGAVQPAADFALFADPGSEMPETYENVERLRVWAEERGFRVITVANPVRLEDQLRSEEPFVPIPMLKKGGMMSRQCTSNWKVRVIHRTLRWLGAKTATAQLGISVDEILRAKDSRLKWQTNRFPLLELGLSRDDCIQVIEDAGLPVPPKSACYFCPYTNKQRWLDMAREHPELLAQAVDLEEVLGKKLSAEGRKDPGPWYLSTWRRPLSEVFVKQAQVGDDPDPAEAECDSGHCFL